MPTYDYKCPVCKTTIEIFHSMQDNSKHYCDNCHSELSKVFTIGQPPIYKGADFTKSMKC